MAFLFSIFAAMPIIAEIVKTPVPPIPVKIIFVMSSLMILLGGGTSAIASMLGKFIFFDSFVSIEKNEGQNPLRQL